MPVFSDGDGPSDWMVKKARYNDLYKKLRAKGCNHWTAQRKAQRRIYF